MKIPKVQTLSEHARNAPPDAKALKAWLGPYLTQVQALTQALQKFASIGENLNTDLRKEIPFRQGEEEVLMVKVKVGVAGVLVVDSEVRDQPLPRITFRRITNSRIGVRPSWDTDPGGYKWISLLVLGV